MLTFDSRNSAALDEELVMLLAEVDEVEVDEDWTVEIVSPTKTYMPSARPASTSSHGISLPPSSNTVTTGPGTVVVVTASRRSIGDPCLAG